MIAGKGLDRYRGTMTHDKHIAVLHDYFDASECFDNVEIKGGVCYFLWDKKRSTEADIFTHYDRKKVMCAKCYLSNGKDSIFIRKPELLSVQEKVWKLAIKSFARSGVFL